MGDPGRRTCDDVAASDFVSTILLVALVVVVGAVFAVMVSGALSEPPVSESSFSLVRPRPGDTQVEVVLRQGAPLDLSALRVVVIRNGTAGADVPRAVWTTPENTTLRAGASIRFPVTPAVGANETLQVRLIRTDANRILAELGGRVGPGAPALPLPTLTAAIEPPQVPADGATLARLTVRIAHPSGALAVGSVVADTTELAKAAGSTPQRLEMRDDGHEGDVVGGDGIWSATLVVPTRTPPMMHRVTFNVTDALGRPAGTTNATFEVLPGSMVGTGPGGTTVAGAGLTFTGPTSANLTTFRLRNWTWDKLYPERLDDDYVTLRVAGGGNSWSARVGLVEQGGQPYANELVVWNGQYETTYRPRNGTLLPLQGLDMDLKDPVASLQWVRSGGAAHPLALYPNADITVRPTFVVPYFGHDVTTGNQQTTTATGIISVDVVMT